MEYYDGAREKSRARLFLSGCPEFSIAEERRRLSVSNLTKAFGASIQSGEFEIYTREQVAGSVG